MPFALVLIGILLIVTGAKNTYKEFGAELVDDFTGSGNFTYWVVSIGVVGSLGYIPAFKDFSRLFLVLILAAMLISNRGFFSRFTGALQSGPQTPQSAQAVNDAQGVALPPVPQSSSNPAQNAQTVWNIVSKFFLPF